MFDTIETPTFEHPAIVSFGSLGSTLPVTSNGLRLLRQLRPVAIDAAA